MDYLLSCPFGSYTKQQIAIGAEISRATLNNFFEEFLENNILIKNSHGKYELNIELELVKRLNSLQEFLSQEEIKKQEDIELNTENLISDEEVDEFLDDIPDVIDLDSVEEEINKKEEIYVNKLEYEFLKEYYIIYSNDKNMKRNKNYSKSHLKQNRKNFNY
jgi:hypothetical protein